jgi:hypothetical protein
VLSNNTRPPIPGSGAVAYGALVGGVMTLLYMSVWAATHQYPHTSSCNDDSFVGAYLWIIDPLGFHFALVGIWFVCFSLAAYYFLMLAPFRDLVWPSNIVLRWVCRGLTLLACAGAVHMESQHTRICANETGFRYRLPLQPEQHYQWSDVRAFGSICQSHGSSKLTLIMDKGPDILLPSEFLFANGQERLLQKLDSLGFSVNGTPPPLDRAAFCPSRYR